MNTAGEYCPRPSAALDFRLRLSTLVRGSRAAIAKYLVSVVPCVSAQTLAGCRIILGVWIAYFWFIESPRVLEGLAADGPTQPITKLIESKTFLLTYLSADHFCRVAIYWAIAVLLIAFVVGLCTRILYPLLVALFWLAAFIGNQDHFITPLLLGMTATLFVPWSERWSVDSLLSGQGAKPSFASPYYGYGIWLLGLVIGLTYTTAGLSKLVITDGGWLWDTGVRNGFIRDFYQATTDWGMILSNNYLLAVGASMLSALGQGVYVYACFTRSAWVKAGIGAFIAFPFLIGLVFFMGLFWWPWVILVFILYIPWTRIDKLVTRNREEQATFGEPPQANRHRAWFLATALTLIGVHAYATLTNTEYEPIFSNYPMYAKTMRAGSAGETTFWTRVKAADKYTYRRAIQLVSAKEDGTTETRDLTTPYSIGWFLARHSLWRMDITDLNPDLVFTSAAKGNSLDSSCKRLRAIASSLVDDGAQAKSLRYFKRYVDIVHGKLVWVPVTNWVEVDLTVRGCPYRQVSGALQ